MKIQWNNCFLCLNDLMSPSGIGELDVITKKKAEWKVLFKYLLDTRNQTYDHVLEDIVRTLEDKRCDEEVDKGGLCHPVIQLCGNCERIAADIASLHMQLEAIQMKIINRLKTVKGAVLGNSKLYGNNEGTKIGLEVFEEWLNEQEKCGVNHPNERKILDCLYAFQTAVFEKDKDSIEIPRVFLAKYANVNRNVVADDASPVKTEPMDNGTIDMDELTAHDLDDGSLLMNLTDDDFDEPLQDDTKLAVLPEIDSSSTSLSRSKGRKRDSKSLNRLKTSKPKIPSKSKRTKRKNESSFKSEKPIVKEDPENESQSIPLQLQKSSIDDTPSETRVRKKRTAASVASHRISEIKYEQDGHNNSEKKSVTKRKRKTETEINRKERTIDTGKSKRGSRGTYKNKGCYRPLPSFASRSKLKGCHKSRHIPMYACDNCSYTTISAKRFEVHLLDHETDEKIFKCDICTNNRSFSGKQFYDLHMAFHEGYNRVMCDFCRGMFRAVDLAEHMKTHVEKVFPCPNCTHYSSSREKYLHHLQLHGAKGKLWCDICDKMFESRRSFLKHLHEEHKVIEKIACGIGDCKKTFLDPILLRVHKKIHLEPADCPVCGKRFENSCRLKLHFRNHTGEKPIKCEHCTESFKNKQILGRHLITVHGGKKVKCDKCSNEYSSKAALQIHMVVHDDSGIPCEYPGCDKKFGNKTLWRRHQSCHTNERNYVCEECGQQLKTAQWLKNHMRTHNAIRDFKCSYCDKAFSLKKYLAAHIRIHTGEKPFVCEVCGKAFNQAAGLYMHKKRHVGDTAVPDGGTDTSQPL